VYTMVKLYTHRFLVLCGEPTTTPSYHAHSCTKVFIYMDDDMGRGWGLGLALRSSWILPRCPASSISILHTVLLVAILVKLSILVTSIYSEISHPYNLHTA